jgi:adenylate kinase
MSKRFVEAAASERLLFDGFPRKVFQAEFLDTVIPPDCAVCACSFEVSDSLIIERVLHRFSCARCGRIYNDKTSAPKVDGVCDHCGSKEFKRRNDDNEESMRQRLENYRTVTSPMLNFYRERGILERIDASVDVSCVSSCVERLVYDVLQK